MSGRTSLTHGRFERNMQSIRQEIAEPCPRTRCPSQMQTLGMYTYMTSDIHVWSGRTQTLMSIKLLLMEAWRMWNCVGDEMLMRSRFALTICCPAAGTTKSEHAEFTYVVPWHPDHVFLKPCMIFVWSQSYSPSQPRSCSTDADVPASTSWSSH